MDFPELIERVREMKREAEVARRAPGKVVLSPQDVAEAKKLAPPQGGPYGSFPLTLWGLEVLESEFVRPGDVVMLQGPTPSFLERMTSPKTVSGFLSEEELRAYIDRVFGKREEPERPKVSFERPPAKAV